MQAAASATAVSGLRDQRAALSADKEALQRDLASKVAMYETGVRALRDDLEKQLDKEAKAVNDKVISGIQGRKREALMQ